MLLKKFPVLQPHHRLFCFRSFTLSKLWLYSVGSSLGFADLFQSKIWKRWRTSSLELYIIHTNHLSFSRIFVFQHCSHSKHKVFNSLATSEKLETTDCPSSFVEKTCLPVPLTGLAFSCDSRSQF